MTRVLAKAWILYKNHFSYQIKSKMIWFLIFWAVVTVLGTSWDENYEMVRFLSIKVGNVGDTRVFALQDIFVQLFQLTWLIVLFFYNPMYVLIPISQSYTVSNTLWLRLSPVSHVCIEIMRSLIIFGIALFFYFAGIIWAMSFSIFHGVGIRLLIQPATSLLGFMFMTGGLMMWVSPGIRANTEIRYAVSIIVSAIPLILFIFRHSLSNILGLLLPYAYPYSSANLSSATLKASISAALFGVILGLFKLIFNLVFQYLSHLKHIKP